MWTQNWRDEIWSEIEQPWDLIVIGGGITGAGVLREATRLGLRVLLIEKRDFASGTSSRSSKLVHGGLRYLRQGQVGLMAASVREREQLLQQGAGLVRPLGFLLASYKGDRLGRWLVQVGLALYDFLAGQWNHRYYGRPEFKMLAPHLHAEGLKGGFAYEDAQTDDARLVLRLLREAVAAGGTAINYVAAESLVREEGRVSGILLRDEGSGRSALVRAKAVVNATGAWADGLRALVGGAARLRPLRGSHFVFPQWRLPVAQAISVVHPLDGRHISIVPWEGVTLVGTTDLDHDASLDEEPRISPAETAYLMAVVESRFPSLGLTLDDVIATFAGVRPVVDSGKADPSRESRDHVVWQEEGLLTVTGGKLTTFQCIAHDALKALAEPLGLPPLDERAPALNTVTVDLPRAARLSESAQQRLIGRYGAEAPAVVEAAQPEELEAIPCTETLWAELRWAARAEGVVHLDDLLLRRVRLGLLLPGGGVAHLERIRAICQPELGWHDERWEEEEAAYLALWKRYYSPPPAEAVPDWRATLRPPTPRSPLRPRPPES